MGVFVWLVLAGLGGGSQKAARLTAGSDGNSSSSESSSQNASSDSLDSLVVPGVQPLDEGQQATDTERARRANPQAIAARERSRTEFAHLGATRAAQIGREAFPEVIEHPVGATPQLPAGDRVVGYASANAEQLSLPGGKHAVMESLAPIARKESDGSYTPIDLSLTDAGPDYVPASSNVAVQIPKQLSAGAQLPEHGISLMPVDLRGRPLSGSEGSIDGVSVFYANTQTDTDILVKPTVGGLQMDDLLRSAESPQQFYFKVGLPQGARLVQEGNSGVALVEREGVRIAEILTPSATDAAQTPVPVSMQALGDVLSVGVQHRSGSFQYPVELDPELRILGDERAGELYKGVKGPTNWKFVSTPVGTFSGNVSGESISYEPIAKYSNGQSAAFSYETQGDSKIYHVSAETSGTDAGSNTETTLKLFPVPESFWRSVNENYPAQWVGSCDKILPKHEGCEEPGIETEHNKAVLQTSAYGEGVSRGFVNNLLQARVAISQETSPTISFNTTSATLVGGSPNIFHGAGGWLGPSSGAFEVEGADAGLGISHFEINTPTRTWEVGHNYLEEHKCSGVQCSPSLKITSINGEGEVFWYSKSLPDGEDAVEAAVENPMAMWSPLLKGTLKVDSTGPYNIKLTSGLPESGGEISAAPHQVTVEATDGTKPTPSSGIKSIALAIDGREIGVPAGSCSPGECSTHGTWTINGESIGAGEHKLLVTATDNAGNVTTKPYTFAVRNATPVALGPGTVDPVTGQFKLTATDAFISGAGGMSRTYLSRSPVVGAEGPLGPQWSLSFGSGQSLRLLPNGAAELTGASGGLTTFASNGTGGFMAPKGDGNLTLESKEKESGKGITEYLLKNPTAGTTTTFTQPVGSQFVKPTYFSQFAHQGTGNGQLKSPTGLAVDAKGNAWIVDTDNNRVQEFNEKGEYQTQIGSYGTGNGQFDWPSAIAIDSKGNLWITDSGNSRIEEFNEKGVYIQQFGTEGSGNGQLRWPDGIALDSKGNVWVADTNNDRVQEFNEKGGYITQFGSPGSGNGQFWYPQDLAMDSNGHLWVTDLVNGRVQEFNETGGYLGQFGSTGTGNGQLYWPTGIAIDSQNNMWIVDTLNHRVDEFNEKGEYLAQFGSQGAGSGQFENPKGIALNAKGSVWITDGPTGRVDEWTHPFWLATRAESAGGIDVSTESYRTTMTEEKIVTEPTEELGTVPAGVSCSPKLEKGCRALTFTYAGKTTATGENESLWGEYTGRLMKISFTGYNPSAKIMETKTVAEYSYDKQGRLRAEWDPRISPALKTIYGYDAEGHITALTPPGQESWALIYGTISGDSNTGRLLKLTRASASAKLWKSEAPKNTEAPKLSGSPVMGMTLGVTNGTWANEPVAYTYQWEDCNAEGKECAAISGAANANYTVASSDSGHTLVAQVTAINGGGSVADPSLASGTVAATSAEYALPSGSAPSSITTDPDGNLWYVNEETSKVGKMTTSGTATEYALPTGSAPSSITAGPDGNLWYTDKRTAKIGKISTSGTITEYTTPSADAGITAGPDGNLWYTNWGTSKIGKITTSGVTTEYALPAGSHPSGITEGTDGNLWFVDLATSKVGKITTSGAITEYALPAGSEPTSITAVSDSETEKVLWFTEYGTSKIGKISWATGAITEYALPAGSHVASITPGLAKEGGFWFTDNGTSKVGKISTSGVISEYGLPSGSEPTDITTGPDLNIWFTNHGTSRIGKMPTSGGARTEGEHHAPQPGSTIEYRVPLSGAGLPTMTEAELAKWGQTKNLPTEATAIFPPDEPMGWPASGYKRATILYRGERALTTNVAVPGGGISTTEYNHTNDVTRILSADNRAAALKEGSKSAEVAQALSSENIYNSEETQLVETIGPEHKIKLANGTEVEARNHQKLSYNEEAPTGETHETYSLVTKKAGWAQTSAKAELAMHEATMSYSGQGGIGWKLRKPTAVTTTVNGHQSTQTTTYQPTTGKATETVNAVSSTAPVFLSMFGHEGTEEGQFREPMSEAFDSSGNLWVVDSGNDRVQEFSSAGLLLKKFGTEGTGSSQFKSPWGLAINKSTGNIYVSDVTNDRVEEFSSSGVFVRMFGFGVSDGKETFEICTASCVAGKVGSGNGQFHNPQGVAIDSAGNVWVVDEGNSRVEEFNEKGEYLSKFGSLGAGNGQLHEPAGIAISDGNLYVAEYNNSRVQEFSPTGVYINQFGAKGTGSGQFEGAEGISADPVTGDLYVTDFGNGRVEEFTTSGTFLTSFGSKGAGGEQFKGPEGIAVNQAGTIYVADTGNARIQEWEPVPSAPVYTSQFGTKGLEGGQFNEPRGAATDSSGNLWVVDTENSRLEKFSPSGSFLAAYGSHGSEAGQLSGAAGIAINQSTGNIYVSDRWNMRVDEFSSSGVFIRTWGFGVSNGKAEFEMCTSKCQKGIEGSGSGEFHTPLGLTADASGNIWVADYGNSRIEEFSSEGGFVAAYGIHGYGNGEFQWPESVVYANGSIYVVDTTNDRVQRLSTKGEYLGQFGSNGSGPGQFSAPSYIAASSTSGNLYVVDEGNHRVQEFTPSGVLLTTFGSKGTGNGQLASTEDFSADGIAVNSSENVYVVDTGNNRVEKWTPVPRPGNEGAKDTKVIEYSAAANTEYPNCGGHAEWAGLTCVRTPAAQPGVSGLPELPVTAITYNMWSEPETTTETIGSVTRTKKISYDGAGRQLSSEETSSVDTALPSVTDEYSSETGALIKQSTTVEGTAKTITSVYNKLGQLESYTDADGGATKYAYEEGGDGRLDELSYEVGKEKFSQIYSYDATTGVMSELYDSAVKKAFTATYDAEGKMLTEGYPNGMTAYHSYNSLGQATNLEYKKETHCTENCVLFSDSLTYSVNNEIVSQVSTLSKESYAYDTVGRLIETQETPVGKSCVARIYGYNEESERTSLTTRESGTETCATEGGAVEAHSYDVAGRLLDSGVAYDTFGNMTKVPAADAGGTELKSSFYVDNQVASQEQNGQEVNYKYDPEGRARETISKGKVNSTVISHYNGSGSALGWTIEEEGKKWSRNIPGIGGELEAIQTNGETPVLQMHDLQGSIVATAALSETEIKLLSTHNSTEFGVPTEGKAPSHYTWLGADGVASELSSGIVTEGGASYVPQLAQEIQMQPVTPLGAQPNGSYSGAPYITSLSPETIREIGAYGAEAPAIHEAEVQKAEEKEIEEEVNAGGNDPTYYYTSEEAYNLGRRLQAANSLADILGLLAIPDDFYEAVENLVANVLAKESVNPLEWARNAGDELIKCSETATSCKLKYYDYSRGIKYYVTIPGLEGWVNVSIKLVNFFSPARVAWCIGGTPHHPHACFEQQ